MSENFDVKNWLESCGFSEHATAFEENGIGRDELLQLNENNLKELGIVGLGDRKRLMQEIAKLKKNVLIEATKEGVVRSAQNVMHSAQNVRNRLGEIEKPKVPSVWKERKTIFFVELPLAILSCLTIALWLTNDNDAVLNSIVSLIIMLVKSQV